MPDQTVHWQAREIYFTHELFYLHGILKDINEQDTSFLDCKHKHMMKVGVLHCLSPIEFHGFTSRSDLEELSLFGY